MTVSILTAPSRACCHAVSQQHDEQCSVAPRHNGPHQCCGTSTLVRFDIVVAGTGGNGAPLRRLSAQRQRHGLRMPAKGCEAA